VKPEVSDLTGYSFRGADGVGDLGLVDVAEPDLDFPQEPVRRSPVPGGMANFQDERILSESITQFPYISPVLVGIVKRVGKLEEKGSQATGFHQGGQAVFEGPFIRFGQGLPGMGEIAVEFGGEFEPGIGLDSSHPALAHGRSWGAIKSIVKLNGVEKLGQINQGVKLNPLLSRGINNPFPILI
jgi:hypothetical protein